MTDSSESTGRGRSAAEWDGLAVTVMGLGLFGGGLGAAAYALRSGANVTVTDQRDAETLAESVAKLRELPHGDRVRLVLGEHLAADFSDADIVIVNPAVPPGAPFLRMARDAGARVTTAIELLLGGLCCRVVAITGTHGKSSTVHFTAALLRAGLGPGVSVAVGGNIGGSLLGEMDSFSEDDVIVLELSSYQLEHLGAGFLGQADRERVVDVAAITSLGVDHLERHGTVKAYHAAKLRIAELTGQAGPAPGTIVVPGDLASVLHAHHRVVTHGHNAPDPALDSLQVPGTFQRDNLALALLIGEAVGTDRDSMRRAIPTLTGLPHRMERLSQLTKSHDGRVLQVHDNGVSTTPESTIAAIESLGSPPGTRLLFVGGQAKFGADFAALVQAALAQGWTLVPFGAAAREIALAARAVGAALLGEGPAAESPAIGRTGQNRDEWPATVEEAVEEAVAGVPKGAASVDPLTQCDADPQGPEPSLGALHLLFSPACASFDRYPNFRARALAFRAAVASATGYSGSGIGSSTEHPEAKH